MRVCRREDCKLCAVLSTAWLAAKCDCGICSTIQQCILLASFATVIIASMQGSSPALSSVMHRHTMNRKAACQPVSLRSIQHCHSCLTPHSSFPWGRRPSHHLILDKLPHLKRPPCQDTSQIVRQHVSPDMPQHAARPLHPPELATLPVRRSTCFSNLPFRLTQRVLPRLRITIPRGSKITVSVLCC
jgi:hypothetical protein